MKPSIKKGFRTRPIRFIEIHSHDGWKIKIYSISVHNEYVKPGVIGLAKSYLSRWLLNIKNYPLNTYRIATLILHEGNGVSFAVISWWIDENMLQTHVYRLKDPGRPAFTRYSHKGIFSCVWELEVLWFERNCWVQHVLANAPKPDYKSYLQQHLNKN